MVKIDTIWRKIKSFFRKLFNRKKYSEVEIDNVSKSNKDIFHESLCVREELKEQNRIEKLALKLMYDDVYDLTDDEVDEMTEWFKRDIEEKDRELNRIKEHILQMRKELEEGKH